MLGLASYGGLSLPSFKIKQKTHIHTHSCSHVPYVYRIKQVHTLILTHFSSSASDVTQRVILLTGH